VLSLGTAQRNTAAALVVAGQNFTDAKVVVMITVVMIVSFAMLMPLAQFLARRRQPVGVPLNAAAGKQWSA
jgi:BASS family bile acid:Na+ symporter